MHLNTKKTELHFEAVCKLTRHHTASGKLRVQQRLSDFCPLEALRNRKLVGW